MDYLEAGVNIDKAESLVKWIKSQKPTSDRVVLGAGGGFASLFKAGWPEMKNPCLASAADGVGTKVKLCAEFSSFESAGQDLVAMCVNDLICVGADPLFFLDYYACSKLEESQAKKFLKGVQSACLQSHCALIGGETAEMPGVYNKGEFDCAGFAVGIVDEEKIIGPSKVKAGDKLIALASSGFHSNGYSLLRKVFEKNLASWAEDLLKPTALYVDVFQKVLKGRVHALAHITGGGLDNILRSAPRGSLIQLNPWPVPQRFVEVKKISGIAGLDLLKTLNCGVGMAVFVGADQFQSLFADLKSFGIECFDLGQIVEISNSSPSQWNVDVEKLWREKQ